MSLTPSRWLLPALLLLTITGLAIAPVIAQDEPADDPPVAAESDPDAEGDAPAEPEGDEPAGADPGAMDAAEMQSMMAENMGTADEAPPDAAFIVNNLWVMIAGMLVFIMHLGFATLESGLTRSKNTVNILFKNTMIICIGLLTYGICGFNLMYPTFGEEDGGYLKFAGWDYLSYGVEELNDPKLMTAEYADYTYHTDFFFQAMFAATCATIVSGAVAGRIKLSSFLIFTTLFVSINYPITGSWKWGGGWLDKAGFYDFAGSTLVHSVGGWGALVMAFLLGPRKGKYVDGKVNAMPASNLTLAAIGVFLLWFGWFGFNGGSVLSADPALVSLVLVTT